MPDDRAAPGGGAPNDAAPGGSPLLRLVQERRWDEAIAFAGRPGAVRGEAMLARVVAYCTAMRDGRMEHRVAAGGIEFTLRISAGNFGHDLFVAAGELQEPHEMALAARLLLRDGVLLDIGANAGAWTVFLAKAFPRATVVPFEVVPELCAEIRANVALNGLTNVDLGHLGTAIGRGNGPARMVRDDRHGAVGTSLVRDSAGDVQVRSIDSLGFDRIGFAKIDVEGQELAVLDGMAATQIRYPFPIFVEVHERNALRFLDFLCRRQFRIVMTSGSRPGVVYANVLAAPIAG